ncbi:MAG: hypothetical protein MZV63_25410 [Marinilabiliales bacterium]|nr:hypothetical protein [Marinilabiliales bacterium]
MKQLIQIITDNGCPFPGYHQGKRQHNARVLPSHFAKRNWGPICTTVTTMRLFWSKGEEAELYKTFYSEMEYRVAICGCRRTATS